MVLIEECDVVGKGKYYSALGKTILNHMQIEASSNSLIVIPSQPDLLGHLCNKYEVACFASTSLVGEVLSLAELHLPLDRSASFDSMSYYMLLWLTEEDAEKVSVVVRKDCGDECRYDHQSGVITMGRGEVVVSNRRVKVDGLRVKNISISPEWADPYRFRGTIPHGIAAEEYYVALDCTRTTEKKVNRVCYSYPTLPLLESVKVEDYLGKLEKEDEKMRLQERLECCAICADEIGRTGIVVYDCCLTVLCYACQKENDQTCRGKCPSCREKKPGVTVLGDGGGGITTIETLYRTIMERESEAVVGLYISSQIRETGRYIDSLEAYHLTAGCKRPVVYGFQPGCCDVIPTHVICLGTQEDLMKHCGLEEKTETTIYYVGTRHDPLIRYAEKNGILHTDLTLLPVPPARPVPNYEGNIRQMLGQNCPSPFRRAILSLMTHYRVVRQCEDGICEPDLDENGGRTFLERYEKYYDGNDISLLHRTGIWKEGGVECRAPTIVLESIDKRRSFNVRELWCRCRPAEREWLGLVDEEEQVPSGYETDPEEEMRGTETDSDSDSDSETDEE